MIDYDPFSPATLEDPMRAYNELREQCPVLHSQHYDGFLLLTRYDDVRHATTDWRT
mgnify:CR=1 FL=1